LADLQRMVSHIVVTRPLKVERRTVSVRRPKTGVPPTVLRNQPVLFISIPPIVVEAPWQVSYCQDSTCSLQLSTSHS